MQPSEHDDLLSIAERYAQFARQEAHGNSGVYERWCDGIAADEEVRELIASLPPSKRQPNLVLAATRYLGARPSSYAVFRSWLLANADAVRAVVLSHATQTNEAGRTALVLPILAGIPGPIALIEVGASAGLCLYGDRYSHDYVDAATGVVTRVDPDDGPSPVVTRCVFTGPVPLPRRMPLIVSRQGIDLNPLDVADDHDVRWLHALVWPEQRHREERLAAAVEIVRRDPPRIVRGDLNERIAELVDAVPAGVTPVVQHTAVLAYLPEAGRERFAATMAGLRCRWISNEGVGVFPGMLPPAARRKRESRFLLAVDGRPVAYAGAHGQSLDWCGDERWA